MSYKQTVIKSDTLPLHIREMLGEQPDFDIESLEIGQNLSDMQKKAFQKFKNQDSLFIIGSGGVGKSKLLKTMQEYNSENDNKNMHITSTTGVSAYNVNGMTIHSFMGIGTGDRDVSFLIKRVFRNKDIVQRLMETDILVIDELSMLSASLFEKINAICQHFRKNNSFMGGIQTIFTADPMQLLPVFNKNPAIFSEPEDTRLIIESTEFNDKFNKKNKNIITLNKNFRQLNDSSFIDLLNRVRLGNQTSDDIDKIKNKCLNFNKELDLITRKNITPVHLVATNKKANNINEQHLKNLTGKEFKYVVGFNSSGDNDDCISILKTELKSQFKQKNLLELILKNKARVMLIKNLDIPNGLVNGSMGTITSLNSKSVNVLFDNGQKKSITSVEWDLEMNNNSVKCKQIPLTLCYASTIHKTQGLTLEYAILELEECFIDHQVYVALSRVKSFDGLLLKSFNKTKIITNPKMKQFIINSNYTLEDLKRRN